MEVQTAPVCARACDEKERCLTLQRLPGKKYGFCSKCVEKLLEGRNQG